MTRFFDSSVSIVLLESRVKKWAVENCHTAA